MTSRDRCERGYDRIVCSYPLSTTLVVERRDDGRWTERIVESVAAPVDPEARPQRTPDSTTRTVSVSPFLRMEEAAAYVRAGKKRVHRWIRRGLLPETVDPDGRRFFRVEDLDAVMGGGPVPDEAVASAAVPRTKARRKGESWLQPVFPRTKPGDLERG